jgi:hypothetical protein
VVCQSNPQDITASQNVITNPLNICIYQETDGNPLKMTNNVHFTWFFDPFRNMQENYSDNDLFVYQFPIYSMKQNVFRQKYGKDININQYNEYPNCFPVIFNIDQFLKIAGSDIINKYPRNQNCHIFRKFADSHPVKMVDNISKHFIHPSDSISVDGLSIEQSIDVFLKCKHFYCYDLVTFLPVMALLCGCQPILISDYPGFKDFRGIYKEYNPWMYHGMTYFIDGKFLLPEDNGRNVLIDILQSIHNNTFKNFSDEKNSYNNLRVFLRYLECYFNVSFAN